MNIQSTRALRFDVQGVVIHAPGEIITPAIAAALSSGSYEAEEARIVARSLQPGDRVLEIGAGLGFITTRVARDPRVELLLSVEADPRLARHASTTVAENGAERANIVNGVLLNEQNAPDMVTFYQRPDFWMSSLLETDVPHQREVKVPALPLNRTLRENAITCIVCDIEGAEVDLLGGADLSGVDRVIVELHDHITGLSGVSTLFDAMRRKGFAYDPRCAEGAVVLFRRIDPATDRRPYGAP